MAVSLQPLAVRVHLGGTGAATPWPDLLAILFTRIACGARQAGSPLIGHIKGIARAGAAFLRINCVSESAVPDMDGSLPADRRDVALDLAVLVYGLAPETLLAVVEAALAASCAQWSCTWRLEKAAARAGHVTHR